MRIKISKCFTKPTPHDIPFEAKPRALARGFRFLIGLSVSNLEVESDKHDLMVDLDVPVIRCDRAQLFDGHGGGFVFHDCSFC